MSHHDDLWDSAVKEAVEKLPEKHVPWLLEPGNQKPYTTTQLLNNVAREHSKSSSNLFPRFFTSIDPILVHIASFQRSLAVIVAADPTGAGLIWGVFHLLIEVRDPDCPVTYTKRHISGLGYIYMYHVLQPWERLNLADMLGHYAILLRYVAEPNVC